MKIIDLNVLLYAVNSAAAQHDRVRGWWEQAVNDEDTIGLAWVVLLGFLCLATNPRVFPRPRAPAAAAANSTPGSPWTTSGSCTRRTTTGKR